MMDARSVLRELAPTEDNGPRQLSPTHRRSAMTFPRMATRDAPRRKYDIHTLLDIGRRLNASSESSSVKVNPAGGKNPAIIALCQYISLCSLFSSPEEAKRKFWSPNLKRQSK